MFKLKMKKIHCTAIFFALAFCFTTDALAGCARCSAKFLCEAKGPDCTPGERCVLHDDDCGNWESLAENFPDPKEMQNPTPQLASVNNQPSKICVPGIRGPQLPRSGPQAALSAAEGNWLFTAALIRFDDLIAEGVFDSGAFSFTLAETPADQNAALAGKELVFPSERFKGFNGFVEYRTYPADKLTLPGLTALDIEMHVWRVNRAKVVPTHGLKAYLHYEKDASSGKWNRKSVRMKYVMPTPGEGVFSNFDDHKEIVDAFIANNAHHLNAQGLRK